MEPLNLIKGARIDLTKGGQGLPVVKFALGWDEGDNFDPDASAIVLHTSKAFENPNDLLYFRSNVKGYVKDAAGATVPVWVDTTKPYPFIMNDALRSSGDNRTGAGAGDDETITVELQKLPADVSHIALVVTIYDYEARKQNFGMMNNAYCRVEMPNDPNFKPQKADLTEDYSTSTALIFGYLYRKDGEWRYNSLMKGINNDTKGTDGKPIGTVDLATISGNLHTLLEVAVPAAAPTA